MASDPIKDLIQLIDSVPFGQINLGLEKKNRKIASVSTIAEETLLYKDNEEAVHDLNNYIKSLIENVYNGSIHIRLDFKDGNIQLMGLLNKKETKY